MIALVKPHRFSGAVRIPASKSHTIRRLLIAALADGVSELQGPLDSLDTRSCLAACRALGALVREHRAPDPSSPNPVDAAGTKLIRWTLQGRGGAPAEPLEAINIEVGNSGTTLFLALAAAALFPVPVHFDGDAQIRRRSAAPLLAALGGLGVQSESHEGCAPITIRGPWKGGRVSIECPTSQYLSALLLAAPLAPAGTLTELEVPLLNERPYIAMTLAYIDAQGIPCERGEDLSWFRISGGAVYKPLSGPVPADFSSAAFPALAAAVSGGPVELFGLDPGDIQGDQAFFEVLKKMGCHVSWTEARPGGPSGGDTAVSPGGGALARSTVLRIEGGPLRGGEFDLNAAPDMLPACAAAAAFAKGNTALVNAAHARIKETDRIAVMAAELEKLGTRVTERPDGLIIHGTGTPPRGGRINSHGDHRIAMAFAAAALGACGPIEIDGAECAAVTYPGFLELLAMETVREAGITETGK
ncbi:MAG: 3-phosphoshikimate 1-carboxyvinyltransferase [Treponema sp.]|jgi:3-phosphoshikimate 1-carboxyvinyltransferase|nr:3-phosphoshikimate 1-carboxyvinyltransferase [Treponema sp.]